MDGLIAYDLADDLFIYVAECIDVPFHDFSVLCSSTFPKLGPWVFLRVANLVCMHEMSRVSVSSSINLLDLDHVSGFASLKTFICGLLRNWNTTRSCALELRVEWPGSLA